MSAYILPEGFEPQCEGAEIVSQKTTNYACITIRDPFSRAFEFIPNGYKKIMEYLESNGYKENTSEEYLSCFEYVYEKDGVTYMDIYVHTDSTKKAKLFTTFSS